MRYLLYLLFFLFSFGQLGRLSFFDQQINIYFYEVLISLFISGFFLKYQFKPFFLVKRHLIWKRWKSLFLFFFILLFSLLVSFNQFSLFENIVGFLYLLRLFLYFVFFVYLDYYLKQEPKYKKTLFKGLVVFSFITLVISLIQYILYKDLRNLFYLGWDPHLYRMFGAFFDPFLASAVYGLLFFFFLFNYKNQNAKKLLMISFFLFLFLTFSRSGYISFITTLLFYLILNKNYRLILFLIISVVTVLILIPKPFGQGVNLLRSYSIKSRLKDYHQGIIIWRKNPFLGVGFNRIRYVKKKLGFLVGKNWKITHSGSSFHSSFVIILVSSGIIGLINFLWLVLDLSKISFQISIYIIFLSLFSLFDNLFLHPMIIFLILSFILIHRSSRTSFQESN